MKKTTLRLLLLSMVLALAFGAAACQKGGIVAGDVTDSVTGMPVQNAAVRLISDSGEQAGASMTSTDGDYTFKSVKAGLYSLEITAAGYVTYVSPPFEHIKGDDFGMYISIHPDSAEVLGHVTDAASGAGVAGATVSLLNHEGHSVAAVTTDETGAYELMNVVANVYSISVSATNYDPYTSETFDVFGTDNVTIDAAVAAAGTSAEAPPAEAPAATPATPPAAAKPPATAAKPAPGTPGTISGRLMSSASAALANANISLLDSAGKAINTAKSDAKGYYSFKGVLAGTYKISFTADSFTPFTTIAFTVADGAKTTMKTFTLVKAGAIVNGKVTDAASGAPIAKATAKLINASNQTVATVASDGLGDYRIQSISAGSYKLEVFAEGYTAFTVQSFNIGATENVTKNVSLTTTGVVINGRVTNSASGVAVAGATLKLVNTASKAAVLATADANGYYTFGRVGAASYSIEATAPNYNPAAVQAFSVSGSGAFTQNILMTAIVVAPPPAPAPAPAPTPTPPAQAAIPTGAVHFEIDTEATWLQSTLEFTLVSGSTYAFTGLSRYKDKYDDNLSSFAEIQGQLTFANNAASTTVNYNGANHSFSIKYLGNGSFSVTVSGETKTESPYFSGTYN